MPDWEDLHVFGVVFRLGSLSAAARALDVTQPTMRRRLDALEHALGTTLFVRSPSGLSPTEAARALGQHTDAMASAAEAFTRAASGAVDAARGVVRVTASDVVGAEVLPAMLAPLQAMHPGLVIELHLSNRNEDLSRQEADVAVRMAVPPGQAALLARRVGTVALGLFAHRDYLARAGTPASLHALAGHALIGPDRHTPDLSWLAQRGLTLRREDFTLRTDSQLAQLGAIRAGLGIGICQTALAARHPDLVPVLPGRLAPGLETWVAMHEDLRRVRRVRIVFDHLVGALSRYTAAS